MRRVTARVSVVVPTYRRDDLLDRCLAALAAQQFPPCAYEIIVADDAAACETERLVASWAMRAACAVRYLPVTGPHGPAAARNRGWRAARGEIVAFTDDDCLPDPCWLRAGAAAFCDHDGGASGDPVAAVFGRIVVPLPPTPTDYERDTAGLETAEHATANCFYRRDALRAVGGFDERFTAAWREDSDLSFTLLERRARIARAPDAVVIHPVRAARWGISLRQQRKSMFNALLYKKHPALYRARIQPGPPWHYYRIVGALLAALVGIASGRRSLAALGGGAWLCLTVRFCLRRLDGTSHAPRHLAEMALTSAVIPVLSLYWRLRGAIKYRVRFL
jgi:glycosyltransferase involved in cell wall biosynthesis